MPRKTLTLCSIILLLFSGAIQATESSDKKSNFENRYYYLKGLRESYPEEIFNYCIDDVDFKYPRYPQQRRQYQDTAYLRLLNCLTRQKKLQERFFKRALEELGRKSLVQPIYAECLDFYPDSSMSLIGKCMDARIELRRRLDTPTIESEIYARCHQKWRKHSAGAISNCTVHDANYYLEQGKLHE